MVASHESVEQMVEILLKYIDKNKARKMVREMYHKVKGNQSLMETLVRMNERLHEIEDE